MSAAFSLAHFIAVMILLQAGAQWGHFQGGLAVLFHALLFPGWLIYLGLPLDNLFSVAVSYPLNSTLWGFLLARIWVRFTGRRRRTGP
jgi:hypothetical protein